MLGYNNDEKDIMPPLIPIKKKRIEPNQPPTPSQHSLIISHDPSNLLLKDHPKNTPTHQLLKDSDKLYSQVKRLPNPQKMRQIQQKGIDKITNLPKRDLIQKTQNQRPKQNEKMKFLIAQMLNSISAKNTAQQLYPVSNQALQQQLYKIQDSIQYLKNQAVNLQNNLQLNPNNAQSKNQLQSTKRRVNRCYLIKQLYSQQGDFLIKIKQLQQKVLALQTQNNDMKKKVGRGIQTIQGYKHNIPCRKHRQLREQLKTKQKQLTQIRQMRLQLQKQAVSINFKKLYEQADTTRLIVTKKLKEIQQRHKNIKKFKIIQPSVSSSDCKFQDGNKKQDKKLSNTYNLDNYQINKLGNTVIDKEEKKGPLNASMTMEEKINKMRSNQTALARVLPT